MIWNLFRKVAGRSGKDVEEQIGTLEGKAADASPGYQAQYFNRAGDLCAEADDRGRAMGYWGEAIDAYLRTPRPEAAAALCRKIIRFNPKVVRARRTLALLAIGQGHLGEALQQVEAYVDAARDAGHIDLAVKQLRLMGEATWSARFRHRIAELLVELGDEDGAAYVARTLPADAHPDPADDGGLSDEEHERWSTILRIALMPPDEVRRAL